MAGNIKGITIEFNGDTTKLDRALREINNKTKSIDSELRKVNNALKFNPTSVELWRQKQQLLSQKITETRSKLDALKQAQAQMDAAGVDKASEEYRDLQRQIIVTENQLKNCENQLRQVGNVNLRAASEQFKQWGGQLERAGQAMRGISMAAAAVAASIGATAVKSGQWADDLNTLSKRYGISTGELQKYSAAADLVDVSTEAIAKSQTKLTKSMYSASQGSEKQQAAFEALGVSVTNSDGSLRDSDAVFQDVITALGSMENETERDALAMQLMGKSANELNPLIEDGGETYKNVADTMSKYGLDFIDEETLQQANEFNDALDTIKLIGLVTFQSLGTELAGYLAPALEKVVGWVGKLAEWLSNLSPQTLTVIATIASVLAVVAPLLIGLGKLSFAISSIMNLLAVIGPALAGILATAGPIILVIGGLVAAGILLYKNWDTVKAKAQALWAKVKAVFDAIKQVIITVMAAVRAYITAVWSAIRTVFMTVLQVIYALTIGRFRLMLSVIRTTFNVIRSVTRSAWNAIKNAITSPIQAAYNKVQSVIQAIKSLFPINIGNIMSNIKTPHFSLDWSSKDFGKLGTIKYPTGFNVSWYKTGGIFDSPSVIGVGEAGPEAVVPLNKFWDKLDKMAEMQPIVVNVYGSDNMSVNELAAAVEQRLIQMQKRRTMAWQ